MMIASNMLRGCPAQKPARKSKVNSASTRSSAINQEGSLTRGAIQQTAEKTGHQTGAKQNADGFRSQPVSGQPDAPEGQKNTVAKK